VEIPVNSHRCRAEDDIAIRNLLGLTALLGDEGDPEDYRRVYAPAATWRMGGNGLTDPVQSGADEIVAATTARRAKGIGGPGSGTRHLVVPLHVEVTGDRAHAVSQYLFLSGTAIAAVGIYRDDLIRTEHGWQISNRAITAD
jgi:hypothetical protein